MIDKKCKNCSELIIPYFGFHRIPNRKLPKELQVGTCKCNIDPFDKIDIGYYGFCYPDKCKGAGHEYYFDSNKDIKFIE